MENTIIFAAGGGNDVFSSIAYIKSMSMKNVAIISVLGLTPFHCLNENETVEPSIIIPTTNMSRYIVKEPPKKIFCMESLIPEILADEYPEITKYACISPKYSAIEQANNLKVLFDFWDMTADTTLIKIIDFGGDILTDGNQSSIISPELDAYVLSVVSNLKDYKSELVVCFPGVDGELPLDYLTNFCLNNSISSLHINNKLWLDSLNNIYNIIKPYRSGNTIPNMIKVLKKDDTLQLEKHLVVNEKKISITKKISVNWELQTRMWIFDIFYVFSKNIFVIPFNSPNYDLLMLKDYIVNIYNRQKPTKNNIMQSSDLFLQFLRLDNDGNWTNKHLNYDNRTEKILFIDHKPGCLK